MNKTKRPVHVLFSCFWQACSHWSSRWLCRVSRPPGECTSPEVGTIKKIYCVFDIIVCHGLFFFCYVCFPNLCVFHKMFSRKVNNKRQRQREREKGNGSSVARKKLQGLGKKRYVNSQIKNFSGGKRALVRKALKVCLCNETNRGH